MSLGSSEVVGYTWVRHGGCRIHLGSLGFLRCALRVVGFIWGRVLMGARLGLMGSSGIVVFTRVIREGRCVHPGSLRSLGCTVGEFRIMRGRCIQSGVPLG